MKKRLLSLLLVLLMVVTLMPTAALAKSSTDIAYPVTGGNIYFDQAKGTITDCDKSVTEAVIPTEIEGITVTSIGQAFAYCTSLTSVEIPASVTSIGSAAFQDCTSLTSIEIPASVTSIGRLAFVRCTGLTGINVAESNAYYSSDGGVLFNKEKTTLISYPAGKTNTSYEIPSGVTSIDSCAFADCTGLTSVTIPDSVTSLGDNVFGSWREGPTSFTSINVAESNADYSSDDGVLFNKDKTMLIRYPTGKTNISYEIPNSVSIIDDNAFRGCTGLTSVTIPNGVTSIDIFTFERCTSLTSVTIPNSVDFIDVSAFDHCPNLVDVYYTGTEEQWNAIYIDACNEYLKNATIHYSNHEHVTELVGAKAATCTEDGYTGDEVCSVCSEIITKGENIAHFGHNYVNGKCVTCGAIDTDNVIDSGYCGGEGDGTNLTWTLYKNGTLEISGKGEMASWTYVAGGQRPPWQMHKEIIKSTDIEAGVTSIGDYAFWYCKTLINATIPDSVANIGEKAFGYCTSLTSITIPNSVTSIGDQVFVGCMGLTSITIPNSVTSIGSSAFSGCTGLTSITIPDSVTIIGEGAFYGCTGLTSITIPDSVTSIGDSAFCGCTGLTSITIPDSVMDVGDRAFLSCTSLTSITIPNSVASIGNSAFSGCTGLISLEIPSSVTSIGESVFSDCTSLTNITIPNSVTSVDSYAFSGCTGLTCIDIPNSVKWISNYAFRNCRSLASIEISNREAWIENYAFQGCTGLTSGKISAWSIGKYAFYGCTALMNVEILSHTIGSYAFQGCTSLETVNIKSCSEIKEYAFQGCTALKTLTLPSNLRSIGEFAFKSCTSLETLNVPGNVYEIGNSAFSGCTALKSVSLPLSLKTVGNAAFRYCDSLADVYYEGDNVQWGEISIDRYNEPLTNATLHQKEHVHSFGNPVITAPNCTEQGFTTRTCKCGETTTDTYVDALGHEYKNGVCSRCGEREAHTHDFVETVTAPTCTEQGYTTYTCSCGETYTKNYVSALGHKTELRNAVEPTCTEDGYTGDEVCTICGETIKEGEVIPATGHHFKGNTCPDCGETRSTADTIRAWFQESFNNMKNFFDKIFGRN